MKNFIYKTEIESPSAYVRDLICVQAESREEADYAAKVAMIDWWGIVDGVSDSGKYWVMNRDEGETVIRTLPDFVDEATNDELATLRRFGECSNSYTSDDPIPDLQEAVEYGMNLDHPDVKKGIVDLFGESVYARLKIEEES